MAQNCWHIPTSDQEIVDVFCEEVDEILESIDGHMKTWMSHPGDKKILTEIRRSFHTLKGSGRMVKALDLSEMAWKVEHMLNQAIAGIVPVSEAMVKLVASVRAQIPRMMAAFKNRHSIAGNTEIVRLMKLADTLAAERKPAQVSALLDTTATRSKQNVKLYEFNLKLDRCMQRADEALHRSEMALQEARRISNVTEELQNVVGKRDCGAEVDRIAAVLEGLSKQVSEMRSESKNSQRKPADYQTETNDLSEPRMRARLAPMELLVKDIKQDIEENRRAVSNLRRFGWLSSILSAAIGGIIATGLLMTILFLG